MHKNGGEGGIRTHGTLARTPVFKTGAFDHSATSPASFMHDCVCRAARQAGAILSGRAHSIADPGAIFKW